MRKASAAQQTLHLFAGRLILALLLLCNPNIHLFDLLPDVLGYLLLWSSLRRIGDVDESFAESCRLLRRLAWLSVARAAAFVWCYVALNDRERPTALLTVAFVLAVLELMTALPMITQLFHGLSYLAMRNEGKLALSNGWLEKKQGRYERKVTSLRASIAATQGKTGIRYALRRSVGTVRLRRLLRLQQTDQTARVERLTVAFTIVKVAACVLPELSALSDGGVHWYSYVGVLRTLSVLLVLTVGIVWLLRTQKFARLVLSEQCFWARIAEQYDACHAAHPEWKPKRAIRAAFGWMCAGAVFVANLSLDGVNFLPTPLFPLCALVGIWLLRPYLTKGVRIFATLSSVLFLISSTVSYVFSVSFFLQYDLSKLDRSIAMQQAYRVLLGVVGQQVFFFLLLIVSLTLLLRTLAKRFSCYAVKAERRRFLLKCLLLLLFAMICGAGQVLDVIFLPTHPQIWLVELLTAVCFIVAFFVRTGGLREDVSDAMATRAGRV